MSIQFKTGCSRKADPNEAIRDLARQISLPNATLTAIFVSPAYNLNQISTTIKTMFKSPVIGCTTSGEISENGYESTSICGFSISGDELSVKTFHLTEIRNLDAQTVQQTISNIKEALHYERQNFPEKDHFGLMLIDGLSIMEEHIAATFGNALSDIPILGGSAGDDLKLEMCSILINDHFISDAALFCLFSTTLPFRIVKSQHFTPTDPRLVITKAQPQERIVYEINGLVAVEEYSRVTGISPDCLGPPVFSRYPLMLQHSGDSHVRSIQKINHDGSLTFFCAIDEGVVFRVAQRLDMCEALLKTLHQAEEEIGPILFTIGFDCILRRLESKEFNFDQRIKEIFNNYNVVGFCTYGEQINSIHVNQTFTGIVVGAS